MKNAFEDSRTVVRNSTGLQESTCNVGVLDKGSGVKCCKTQYMHQGFSFKKAQGEKPPCQAQQTSCSLQGAAETVICAENPSLSVSQQRLNTDC